MRPEAGNEQIISPHLKGLLIAHLNWFHIVFLCKPIINLEFAEFMNMKGLIVEQIAFQEVDSKVLNLSKVEIYKLPKALQHCGLISLKIIMRCEIFERNKR